MLLRKFHRLSEPPATLRFVIESNAAVLFGALEKKFANPEKNPTEVIDDATYCITKLN